jgi:hypothetical protein
MRLPAASIGHVDRRALPTRRVRDVHDALNTPSELAASGWSSRPTPFTSSRKSLCASICMISNGASSAKPRSANAGRVISADDDRHAASWSWEATVWLTRSALPKRSRGVAREHVAAVH